MEVKLPILKGLQASYDALATKDANVIYITEDTNRIYLGEIKISEGGKIVSSVAWDDALKSVIVHYTDGTESTIDHAINTVSLIEDATDDNAIPNVGAIKKALRIGEF